MRARSATTHPLVIYLRNGLISRRSLHPRWLPHAFRRTRKHASEDARACALPASGFTLIELVVILLLLTVIFSMVGINLTRDDSDVLRDEADRMAVLIQSAQEEAIMQARPFALTPAREGYEFLRMDDEGKLKPIGPGDLLGPRTLTAPVAISSFEIDGAKDAKDPILVFEPSGVMPSFTIVLRLGETRWYVQGQASGKVQSLRTPLTNAA